MSIESRVAALEKHYGPARTFLVWTGDDQGLADVQAQCGPHDQIVIVGWLTEPLP